MEHLCLWHGQRAILSNVSFTIPTGQTLALIGASGSGKTSLARLLLGVLPGRTCDTNVTVSHDRHGFRWSGRAEVLGVDMLQASLRERRKLRGAGVGLIVQALADALNPHQTVLQHIAELLPVSRHRQAEASSLCTKFNIPQRLLHRYPASLSGGEIQRVLTALALVKRPKALILDEPTAALDRGNRIRAVAVLDDGRAQRSQLLITHDLELAEQMADQVAILHGGALVDTGPVVDMLAGPGAANTKSVIGFRAGPTRRHNKLGITPLVPSPEPFIADPPGLVVQNVSYQRGSTQLLRDVSCVVTPGRCLAVLGPSGCGKTTFARLLAGYDALKTGQLLWRERLGAPPRTCHPGELALVSQHPHRALARHMTVAEVLVDTCRLNRGTGIASSDANMMDLLEKVDLPRDEKFLSQRAADLSGGEAQRLVIARALSSRPRCLIADESTASLDQVMRDQILHLLRRLMTEDKLALIVFTHDPKVAGALGHDIRFLSDGQLRLSPSMEDVA
ncbi:ABC transporter ATP-binding protein [Phaeobacter sp. C3_T13_0]|uniref:ABC transporter ATP-binding protein n=1 Tax=Phaeobacter cretensis TaxID=3342641 RepID=UPI0039BD726C